jgi:hypothetical protein
MERGLLWLPLLAVFIGLAWAGWNEYRKVEAYHRWAQEFEQSKYDILSVLGLKDRQLVFGKPTRYNPVELQTFSLDAVATIRLLVNEQPVALTNLPKTGKVVIEFILKDSVTSLKVPFTDIELAAKWTDYLQSKLE